MNCCKTNISWIKNLAVGDKVWQVETHPDMPNGTWRWKGIVTKLETCYVEIEFRRDYDCAWLNELTKKLTLNRTHEKEWKKNYFDTNGEIAIELVCNNAKDFEANEQES